jgi:hypothetical protein
MPTIATNTQASDMVLPLLGCRPITQPKRVNNLHSCKAHSRLQGATVLP